MNELTFETVNIDDYIKDIERNASYLEEFNLFDHGLDVVKLLNDTVYENKTLTFKDNKFTLDDGITKKEVLVTVSMKAHDMFVSMNCRKYQGNKSKENRDNLLKCALTFSAHIGL